MKIRIIPFIFSLFLALGLIGCASLNLPKLKADANISASGKILPLAVEIDSSMFKKYRVYIGEYENYQRFSGKWRNMPNEKQVELIRNQKSNRFSDAVMLFEQTIETNICQETVDKTYGFAVCRIREIEHSVNAAWFVPSILTLTVINWFGFPIASQTTAVTAEIEILNAERQAIAVYSAKGKGTAYSALYWGYWGGKPHGGSPLSVKDHLNVTRGSHARALLEALKQIKIKIENEASQISQKLTKGLAQ